MFSLKGKVALVTGSSRGIGRGIAIALAKAGADVVVNYAGNAKAADEVVSEIQSLGQKAIAIQADCGDKAQVDAMFDAAMKEFGRIDILINNAGTSQDKDIFSIELEDWDRIIKTNLTSGYLCSKRAMEIMRDQNCGRIIFISSVVGQRGALYGHVHYAATKAGQIGMAKTMARTAAPYNITVNAIAPGFVATELFLQTHGEEEMKKLAKSNPVGFIGSLDDIGAAAVYLASDEARYITGATIDVNGGNNFR